METAQGKAWFHLDLSPFNYAAVTLAVVAGAYVFVFRKKKRLRVINAPSGTVVLYQLPRGPYAPSVSPFPIKLETYLRLAGIPYQNHFGYTMSPKGKTPWISYNDEPLADSQICIEFLNSKFGVDLNQGLSKQEKAVAHALRVMVEEHLYWCLAYFRWVYGLDQPFMKQLLPWALRYYVSKFYVRPALHGQGLGRHSLEEIKKFLLQDLQALADQLGTKPFLMGDNLTVVDCSAFGMLAQLIFQCSDDVLSGLVKERFPSLYEYCDRIKTQVWPDWEDCITRGGTHKPTK